MLKWVKVNEYAGLAELYVTVALDEQWNIDPVSIYFPIELSSSQSQYSYSFHTASSIIHIAKTPNP